MLQKENKLQKLGLLQNCDISVVKHKIKVQKQKLNYRTSNIAAHSFQEDYTTKHPTIERRVAPVW